MSMYLESKEIPAGLLEQVLRRPEDPAWVDGLLFVEDGGGVFDWSEAASRSVLDDEELSRRFTCPYLDFSGEERRRLASYDLGTLFDWHADEEFWHYMATVDSGATAADLGGLLDASRETWWAAIEAKRAVASTVPESVVHDRPTIRSEVPCYGINSYNTPTELTAVWQRIDRAVTSHPDLTGRVVDLFSTDIRYHYGCAARGSAKLSVIW